MALAATALLVETAVMDETFDEAERATVTRLIGARFALDPAAATAVTAWLGVASSRRSCAS